MPVFFANDRPAVFYVHVPKTGGTRIEQLFQANGYRMTLWSPRSWGLVCSPQHFHRALWEPFTDPAGFGLAFLTVRHPIDRLVSHYRDVRKVQPDCPALEPWLEGVSPRLAEDPLLHDNHLRAQWEFAHPDLLVVRQEENFDVAWAKAFSDTHHLGFKVFDVESRRTPSPPTRLSRSELQALSAFCSRFYARDFQEFGYVR